MGRNLDLIDDRGIDVSSRVDFGDCVTHVDDMEVANFSCTTVEKMLAGPRNSTATVCVYSVARQQEVVLELRRHVPEARTSASAQSVQRSPPPSTVSPSNGAEPKLKPVTEFEAAGRMPVLTDKARESIAGMKHRSCMHLTVCDLWRSDAVPCRRSPLSIDEDASSR